MNKTGITIFLIIAALVLWKARVKKMNRRDKCGDIR
tara:strand:- start:654 stop:761 length:108 start_codon:yes stop_codon:yes gene_type:complete